MHRTARTVSTASTDRSARVSENEDETRAATFSSRMEERDSGGSAIGGGSIRILGGRRTSARARVGPSCAQRIPTAPSDTLNGVIHEDQFNSSSSQYYIRNRGVRRDGYAGHAWNFERLASTPLLAAAFEEFSRKALCHESVLFLSAVCRCVRLSLGGVLSCCSIDVVQSFKIRCVSCFVLLPRITTARTAVIVDQRTWLTVDQGWVEDSTVVSQPEERSRPTRRRATRRKRCCQQHTKEPS